jgi:glycosyltransferase involved in cell wall biosynthesis
MRVLFLDPYHAGSHRAFARGWRTHSIHDIVILELPGRHWKWRMRHGAWTLAQRALELGDDFEVVVTTDMLDLAAWRGFAGPALARLPVVSYFHESQLSYPAPHDGPRDLHFAFTNLFSAAAADEIWFNSAYHRDHLIADFSALLARMPDFAPDDAVKRIGARSKVAYPGFALAQQARPAPGDRRGPCHILWAARWEQDKAPTTFFAALTELRARGVDFTVSAIGRDNDSPIFAAARTELAERVVDWGWQESRADYEAALARADIVVSTAEHEFFGIAMVEAVAAGAFPLLPRRLAYPEIFASFAAEGRDDGFYDGNEASLAERLTELCQRHRQGDLWQGDGERGRRCVSKYDWVEVAATLDDGLTRLVV